MNLAFSLNNDFAPKFAACLASLLTNSKEEDFFKIFILSNDITEESIKKIEELKVIKHFELECIDIDDTFFSKYPADDHIKSMAYYRLLLPSILKDEKKVLYIDVDTIILGSLSDLYFSDLGDNYAIVVENMNDMTECKIRLKLNKYFNSGVMLFNLKKMRADHIEQKCFDFINNYPGKVEYHDQCILNAVLRDKVVYGDTIWNFQHHILIPKLNKIYKDHKKKIRILHFVTERKPWNFRKNLEMTYIYYKYLSKTTFRNYLFFDMGIIINIIISSLVQKIKKTHLLYKLGY